MSEIRVENIIGETGFDAVKFTKGINVTGVTTATTFSGSGASLTSLPAANLTGTLPAISGANLTGISTPLVAYKAKEMLYDRYSFSSSTWTELKSDFRISHTPAAVGNTIICHTMIHGSLADGTYGGYANVTDQGSGSDEAMLGESAAGGTYAKANILGGNRHNEMYRIGGGSVWMGMHIIGYHVTENTNAHLFKLFGRMGSGTRYIGDNQMGQLMQIWEYQGNVMQ